MSNQKKIGPPDENSLREAMMLILGSLPHGADIHYYWEGGVQHMCLTLDEGDATVYKLNRNKDGSGVVSSTAVH